MCDLYVNCVVYSTLYTLLRGPNYWPAVLSNNTELSMGAPNCDEEYKLEVST